MKTSEKLEETINKKNRSDEARDIMTNQMAQTNEVPIFETNVKSTRANFEPRRRVAIDMKNDIHKKLKILAVTEDVNMFELVEEAVEMYLEQRLKNSQV